MKGVSIRVQYLIFPIFIGLVITFLLIYSFNLNYEIGGLKATLENRTLELTACDAYRDWVQAFYCKTKSEEDFNRICQ